MDACLNSSKRMDWQTPDNVLELVRKIAPVALDPCTTADNPCGASKFLHQEGLFVHWEPLTPADPFAGLVYVNPPYGRELKHWIEKCCNEGSLGCHIILLVPSRTDTAWYDRAISSANAVCDWRGRLRFKGSKDSAPFPSVLFYWGPSPHLFCHVFQDHGRVRVLR